MEYITVTKTEGRHRAGVYYVAALWRNGQMVESIMHFSLDKLCAVAADLRNVTGLTIKMQNAEKRSDRASTRSM